MYHPDMNLAGQRVEDTALALPLGEQDAVIKRNGENSDLREPLGSDRLEYGCFCTHA